MLNLCVYRERTLGAQMDLYVAVKTIAEHGVTVQ